MITHPGTNRVGRSATTLIETNVLPLSQTANLVDQSEADASTCIVQPLQPKALDLLFDCVESVKHIKNYCFNVFVKIIKV